MIQIIMMLLGLAFSDNNANTTATENNNYESAMSFSNETGMAPGDTSGETGQILPPKK
ncbi:hypothetical protein J2795_002580 [Chryseobacterium bernardetii]|uniref:Uncharacterized protein n=2 Tax=Chryseobacterium TaxID=59732 RepID=A0A543EAX9_9FLAO|nr:MULTISPECIES: hypothetical protein [Chryseobacterium]MDR6371634.1 hypothetical protein [Chryseobacterium vietnamense]MDR6441862.1 hypothetical protein [Chryseobacterium bernardetii]TQM18740.1 hypothetical protein FB551_3128 [Chryseobacterium aquifrigidense]